MSLSAGVGVVALVPVEAGGHLQHVAQRDGGPPVGGPLGEPRRHRLVDAGDQALVDGDADQGAGDALGHRPAGGVGVGVGAVGVPLGDELAVVEDDDALGVAALGEGVGAGVLEAGRRRRRLRRWSGVGAGVVAAAGARGHEQHEHHRHPARHAQLGWIRGKRGVPFSTGRPPG